MSHFSTCCPASDTYLCQRCTKVFCGSCKPSTWMDRVGNLCPTCVKGSSQSKGPISLYEHCRIESGGLEGVALDRYINRYYGNG